jgi:hypothetical protein
VLRPKRFDFSQITNYPLYVMNDSPEEEEDDATTDILIGEGDDWPEDYSDGFGGQRSTLNSQLWIPIAIPPAPSVNPPNPRNQRCNHP